LNDWTQIRAEVVQLLQNLIRINTTNPPGNELEAARYLQGFLDGFDIHSVIHESAPGRANLLTRLPGHGTSRPLILLSHLDVVTANPSQWSHPPFAAEVADGYLWGRGALDMKGMLAMEAMALVLLKRAGVVPSRDIILLAAADEEVGGVNGMEWLIKQDIPGLKEAEYVINEGGEGTFRDGVPVYSCQNGEKGLLWVKLSIPGTPGHASMPSQDNAILHMAKVLNRIARQKRPVTLCDTSRAFLKELAIQRGLILNQRTALDYTLQLFASRHFKEERSVQAMLYNTVSPTILRAGEKTNVLPEVCELTLDCRLLPGETPGHFLEEIKAMVNDPTVSYEILQAADPTESPFDTELYALMRQAVETENPRALLVPYLSPGATDSRFFRQRGITAYGFMPVLISESELQRMHGIDERISLDNLESGTRILFDVLRRLS
jgi:acetylornithine deacetylase/succinyl-diaminopimelate desuccinylase-like protein